MYMKVDFLLFFPSFDPFLVRYEFFSEIEQHFRLDSYLIRKFEIANDKESDYLGWREESKDLNIYYAPNYYNKEEIISEVIEFLEASKTFLDIGSVLGYFKGFYNLHTKLNFLFHKSCIFIKSKKCYDIFSCIGANSKWYTII